MEVLKPKTETEKVKVVEKLIQSTGNRIGSVWFKKRKDGTLRKMSYRIGVRNPTYATRPKDNSEAYYLKKDKDRSNKLITVFDVNKVVRAKRGRRKGKISGRGAYRSIPLDGVIRVCVNGTIYRIRD